MPFAFIIVGLVLLISGVKNTTGNLTTLVKGDFTGSKNFIYWMLAILVIGAIGYIKPVQPLSRMFLVLVIIVLFLSNRGVFASFNSQLFSSSPSSPSTTPSSGITPLSTSSLLAMNNTNTIPVI